MLVLFGVSSTGILSFVFGGISRNRAAETLINQPAPDFRFTTLSGESVTLAKYRGQKVVVSFWASWCGPCQEEMPELRDFYDKYHGKGAPFEVLAISIDDSHEAAQRFVTQNRLAFPVIWDEGGRIAFRYGIGPIPALFVIDENGNVSLFRNGYYWGLQQQLRKELGITTE